MKNTTDSKRSSVDSIEKIFPVEQQTMKKTLEIFKESDSPVFSRPVKAVYFLATVGSKTLRNGRVVTSSTAIEIGGMKVARVGDLVRYPDGSESPIISGAGHASTYEGRPLAIVGSHIENGDIIEIGLQHDLRIIQYADEKPIPGLLEAGYESSTGSM